MSTEIKKAGSMRVKQKADRKPMSDHTLINRFVREINEQIEKLNDLQYAKFLDYTHQLVKNYCNKQNRNHFRHRKDFARFRDGKEKLIYSEVFKPGEKYRLFLNSDLEAWAKKFYSNYGLDNINKLLFMIAASLEKKDYITKDPGSYYNEERFNSACEVLGINHSVKILFSNVRRMYDEKMKELKVRSGELSEIEMEDQRSKINEAFMLIKRQYANYLEELTPKLPDEILIPSDKLIIDENDNVEVLSESESEDDEPVAEEGERKPMRDIPDHLFEIPKNMLKHD
jgi:hypothetical protein